MAIKLVIFDLDGVLIDSRELHYEALNRALAEINPKYVIGREEHLARYDGRPTSVKLRILTDEKGLPEDIHKFVWKLKQEKTLEFIDQDLKIDPDKIGMINILVDSGYQVAIASNSIKDTLFRVFLRMFPHSDDPEIPLYSNEDVVEPKPHPSIYMKAMLDLGVKPSETIIVEDSHIGRKAAFDSGAHVFEVENPSDVNYETVINAIKKAERGHEIRPKWRSKNLRVLIPMAGAGKRFQQAGYSFPKPLIDVKGKPMIQIVIENLNIDAEYIFITQKEHMEQYNLGHLLPLLAANCTVLTTDGLTEGAACTALLAKELINDDKPLLIANSDQYLEWDSNSFLYSMKNVDGGMVTFSAYHPKWSFVSCNTDGFVEEVAEKKVISNQANTGIYYWSHGKDFVRATEAMIRKDIRVNSEFYIAPVYNELIAEGQKIRPFHISRMWGMGTPEDLENFLAKGPLNGQ